MLRFSQDKQRAKAGQRRIPEGDLFWPRLDRRVSGRFARSAAIPTQDAQGAFLNEPSGHSRAADKGGDRICNHLRITIRECPLSTHF